MKINPQNIKYYFLTCDTNGVRKHHIMNAFQGHNITEVHPILGIEKNKSVATGFSRMIDLGLRDQDRTKIFQPFVLFEDDVSKYREFPESIEVPDDADLLFVGLSMCGTYDNYRAWGYHNLHMKDINADVVRMYNMLSLHGIMVCRPLGALALQKCMMQSYEQDLVCDRFTALIQPYYNVYALKKPLVYQNAAVGGVEELTKYELSTITDSTLPDDHHIPILSVATCSANIKKIVRIH